MTPQILFYFFASMALVASVMVIAAKNPITSAVSLVVTLASVAGLYVLQDAHFVATIQVLVYAGAIMVLFIFVIMLLNLHTEDMGAPVYSMAKMVGAAAIFGAGGLLCTLFLKIPQPSFAISDTYGSLESVGTDLFSRFLFPFESISVLLTAAVVGAVIIAKREL